MTNKLEQLPSLMQAATLGKRIDAWGKTAKESLVECVTLMNQALLHFHYNGDATLATKLINAAPEGLRVSDMKQWFRVSAPLVWNQEKEQFEKDKKEGRLPLLSEETEQEQALDIVTRALTLPFYQMFKDIDGELAVFDESIVKRLAGIDRDYVKALNHKGYTIEDQEKVQAIMTDLRAVKEKAMAFFKAA